MAYHKHCMPGASQDVCRNIPCNEMEIPKFPNMAEILKPCPAAVSYWLLLLLLLIPISVGVMFAMRTHILPLIKRPHESTLDEDSTLHETVPLKTVDTDLKAQSGPTEETEDGSESASGTRGGLVQHERGKGDGEVSPSVESKLEMESKLHPA